MKMSTYEILELKQRMRELKSKLSEIDDSAAEQMLETMAGTQREYSSVELSHLTDGVLTPSQAASAVKAIARLQNGGGYSKKGRYSAGPRTKFVSAERFTSNGVVRNVTEKKIHSIACDDCGKPLDGAQVKTRRIEVPVYKLTNNRKDTNLIFGKEPF